MGRHAVMLGVAATLATLGCGAREISTGASTGVVPAGAGGTSSAAPSASVPPSSVSSASTPEDPSSTADGAGGVGVGGARAGGELPNGTPFGNTMLDPSGHTAGAGGAETGAAGASSGSGGSVSSGSGGSMSSGSGGVAGSTAALETPPAVFDPDEVYMVGYVSDLNENQENYGIAPVLAPDHALASIPLFASVRVRPTDGHLLYSYMGADAQGNGTITPVYEFIPEVTQLLNFTKGEAVVVDGPSLCAKASPGKFGGPIVPAGYAFGLDGAAYYQCIRDPATSAGTMSWFFAGLELPLQREPLAIGSGGRILGSDDNDTLVVFDATSGTIFANHTASELFTGMSMAGVVDARAHSGGFWIAASSGSWGDNPAIAIDYVDLDVSGAVLSHGHYAELAQGLTFPGNNWTRSYPVIDGHGSLYQTAMAGDDAVIVRRPMSGQSDIVYHSSQWDSSHPHTVLNPSYLVSGG